MAENHYRVGQVLYIIPIDSAVVVPVQIAERRISETSSGTIVKHIIKSSKQKTPPMILETVKGVVFVDLKQARDFMMKNAATAIDKMIQDALLTAKRAFSPPAKEIEQEIDPLASADLFVDDDQGIQIDEELNVPSNNIRQIIPQKSVQLPPDIAPDGTTEVMGPDGKMQRVRVRAQ